jgi:hypothetical protein
MTTKRNILFSLWFLAISSSLFAQNSGDSLYRTFQISFVPYVGTNGYLSDKTTNDISINILAGYVKEVRKAEFGGMLNMVREDAGKCQLAGVGNLVGGTATGLQGAGMFNMARKMNGIQVAGTLNYAGEASGIQVSGLVNHAGKGKCAQLAGWINNASEDASFQVAGLTNNAPMVESFQVAGLVNNTRETRMQVAGLVNNASKIKGLQVAGLVNNCQQSDGTQISGLVNRASFFKGVQIGFLNIADSCSGTPIGVFSFVKNGYHKFEVSGDEMFYTNLAFRSGVTKFHTIITAGIKTDDLEKPLWTYGCGAGTSFKVNEKTLFDIDMLFQHVIKEDYVNNDYLYKICIGIDKTLWGKTSLAIGATYNFLVTDSRSDHHGEKYADIAPYHFTDKTFNNTFNLKSWAGAKIALRFF